MRGDCHGFHTALVLHAFTVNFSQDGGQSDAFARTYVADCYVELYNAADRFKSNGTHVDKHRIRAAWNGQIYRNRALLRVYDYATVDFHGGRGENHRIAFIIGVGDGLVHQFGAGSLGRVADKELKQSALAGGHAQLRYGPAQGALSGLLGAAFVGRVDACNFKIRVYSLIYYDTCGAGLGDVFSQLLK